MDEITEHNLINSLKEKFPKFYPYWEVYFDNCGSNTALGDDMSPFVDYIFDVIKSENYDELKKVFNYIEFLLSNGDELVQVVIEKCLLVSLIYKNNRQIQFVKLSPYIGEKTLNFLKSWHQFDGSYIEGEWN